MLRLTRQPEDYAMVEISTKSPENFSQRCRILNIAAQDVRRRATREGSDLEGWRLSRLMRDAETDTQVNLAERKYDGWLQTVAIQKDIQKNIQKNIQKDIQKDMPSFDKS
jgi:hypothetical protein